MVVMFYRLGTVLCIIRGDPGPWSFFAIKAITSTHVHNIALQHFVPLAASHFGGEVRGGLFPDIAASANLLDIVGTSLPLNHGMVLANQNLASSFAALIDMVPKAL